jgi:hypothetical protein
MSMEKKKELLLQFAMKIQIVLTLLHASRANVKMKTELLN